MHTENSEKAKQIRVLVSGADGDVAQGIIKCLESCSLNIKTYKTCISKDSSWLYKDINSFIVPRCDNSNYIPHLIKILNKESIDLFIPGVDSEILKISKNKESIESKTRSKVLVGSYKKIKICDDKFQTYNFLKKNNFDYPRTIIPRTKDSVDKFLNNIKFPVICKPREGRGSTNIFKINNQQEAYSFIEDEQVVLQELIKGDEYTAGIYLGMDKKIKGVCVLKRQLKGGSTYKAERVIDSTIESSLGKIAQTLGINYLNVQFILNKGKVIPFEFNGRFSGTTGIIKKVFNAPEMYIKEVYFKEKIEKVDNNYKFKVMRYLEEIYCTESDQLNLLSRSNFA